MSDIINSLSGSRLLLRLMLFAAFASFVAWPLPGLTQQPQRVVEAFGPFKILGNIYYVGDKGNAVYLFTTPDGHILFDTGYPETAPIVRESVEKLGFRMRDIKIMINGHAHVDHVGGHALVKEMTGALIVASELDAPVIESGARRGDFRGPRANPWAPAKVDRIIQHGDTVSLGGVTLTGHHTPGHTLGSLSWTTTIEDGGRRLNVAIMPSIGVNQGVRVVNNPRNPTIIDQYQNTFRILKTLPCDVFLSPHGSHYRLEAKYARMQAGAAQNPFIDPVGCRQYVEAAEARFMKQVEEESRAAR
jgi:metallo-beta-lactamase class B